MNSKFFVKILCVFTFVVVLGMKSLGQDVVVQQDTMVNEKMCKVILNLGLDLTLAYERRIAPQITWNVEAGAGVGVYDLYDNHHFYGERNQFVSSVLKSNVSYYYNYKKRVRKGKNTFQNAADFLSFGVRWSPFVIWHSSEEEFHEAMYESYYLSWGMRRNIWKKFSLQLEIGAGPKAFDDYSSIESLLSIQFAYQFSL